MTQTRLKRNKVSSGFDIPFSIEKQLNPQGNIFKVPMNNCLLTHSLSKKTNIFNHLHTLAATTDSEPYKRQQFPPASCFLSELTRTWYSNFVDLHLNSVVVASSAASQHVAPSWFQVFEDELWFGKSWKFWMCSKHTLSLLVWYLLALKENNCMVSKHVFDGKTEDDVFHIREMFIWWKKMVCHLANK